MWQRVQKIVESVPNHQLEPMEKCKMIRRKFQVFGLLIVTTSVIIFFCDKDFGHELENGKI